MRKGKLTFSNPKNLSLPSSFTGPARASIFSRAEGGGGTNSSLSFFLDDDTVCETVFEDCS